jgi:cytochrome c biogenesis protein CcdA
MNAAMALIRLQNAAYMLVADTNPFETMAKPVTDLLGKAITPALSVFGAVGAIYCIILGAKLAKAEEPQDREKAKAALKNAIIGFVVIFLLLGALKVGVGAMETWYQNVGKTS